MAIAFHLLRLKRGMISPGKSVDDATCPGVRVLTVSAKQVLKSIKEISVWALEITAFDKIVASFKHFAAHTVANGGIHLLGQQLECTLDIDFKMFEH